MPALFYMMIQARKVCAETPWERAASVRDMPDNAMEMPHTLRAQHASLHVRANLHSQAHTLNYFACVLACAGKRVSFFGCVVVFVDRCGLHGDGSPRIDFVL